MHFWWRDAERPLAIAAMLLLIMAIGAFFRFHRLTEIPPQPGSDHVEDLLNIVEIGRASCRERV